MLLSCFWPSPPNGPSLTLNSAWTVRTFRGKLKECQVLHSALPFGRLLEHIAWSFFGSWSYSAVELSHWTLKEPLKSISIGSDLLYRKEKGGKKRGFVILWQLLLTKLFVFKWLSGFCDMSYCRNLRHVSTHQLDIHWKCCQGLYCCKLEDMHTFIRVTVI